MSMKKNIFIVISVIGFIFILDSFVFAQEMPVPHFAAGDSAGTENNSIAIDDHTAREEAEGKIVWEKLKAKQTTCADLSDDDFGVLGEYFMGQIMGTSHEAMNNMMIQMMGEENEEQTHVVMAKRLSGCDTSASFPAVSGGWMPMMNMMWGGWPASPDERASRGWSSPLSNNSTNNMMNFGFTSFGGFGWIFMILWWALIIVVIIALIKWLISQSGGARHREKSPFEILKERYARGEIDKKEFEDKKKDLI